MGPVRDLHRWRVLFRQSACAALRMPGTLAATAWPFQGLIVSERAAKLFESLKLENIAISKIEVLDETPEQSFRQLLQGKGKGQAE